MRAFPAGTSLLILSAAILTLAYAILSSTGGQATGPAAGTAGAPAGFRTQHIVLNSTELVALGADCPNVGTPVSGISGSAGCTSHYAPLHLPDGSRIISMDTIYEDSSAAENIVILISETELDGASDGGTGFRIDSTGSPGMVEQNDSDSYTVDNENFHTRFSLNLKGDPNLTFYSAVITYEVPAFIAGDVDCSGAVNPVDSLKTLRFDAGLPVDQSQPCPPIGQ